MDRIRDAFEKRLDVHVAWAGILTLVLYVLLRAFSLPLEIAPDIDLAGFLNGEFSARVWRDSAVHGFAYAYFAADLVFAFAYTIFFIGVAFRITPRELENRCDRHFMAAVVLLTLATFVADEIENVAAIIAIALGGHAWSLPTMVKHVVMLGPILVLPVLLFRWFFGLGEGRSGTSAATMGLRRAISDILWRNRYNIIALALFAALVIVMDQSRDVLVAMAQAWHDGPRLGAALVTAASAVALWVHAYTMWLSARILGRLRRDAVGVFFGGKRGAAPNAEAEVFAKWWARLLGIAPLIVVVTLSGLAARDAALAGAIDSAYILIAFGAVTIGAAIVFLVRREKPREHPQPGGYYQSTAMLLRVPDPARARMGELAPQSYTFFGLPAAPIALPVVAIAGMTIVRALELYLPDTPSMSFITICLGMTLWVGVFGIVTQLSLLHARPYIAGVIAVVVVLGRYGWTDNHIVWTRVPGARVGDGLFTMLGFHALLAVIVAATIAAIYVYAWRNAERSRRVLYSIPTIGVLAFLLVLGLADRFGPRPLKGGPAIAEAQPSVATRPSLDDALKQWLAELCAPGSACASGKHEPLAVYFVSSEGGGIRAAYWTALVLSELSNRISDFDRRTFSISGVSGGAMGAAIYRACRVEAPSNIAGCVGSLGKGHFLGPMLSTWMFEDIFARVVPTYLCKTPGCGIMSRGAWFEQAMEDVWPAMHQPLPATRKLAGSSHVPYLLLNSTWVETGERAIASDLLVQPARFPTARDQLVIAGNDIPMSTAAHNAARFPYVNAIGSLHTLPRDCPMEKREGADSDLPASCGHLADGGYFDNSGGHTTADVLRALNALLAQDSLPNASWLRENLVPYVLMIRNGVEKKDEPEKRGAGPDAAARDDPQSCGATEPELPRCRPRIWMLTDLIGPLVTALNAVGTGSNGRLAEALLAKEVLALRTQRGTAPVVTLDLTKQNVLYPLGWYLSPTARNGMQKAACELDAYPKLCAPGAAACPVARQCP